MYKYIEGYTGYSLSTRSKKAYKYWQEKFDVSISIGLIWNNL